MIDQLFEELSKLDEVEAIALGGSRAGTVFDDKSDYDVYLYINDKIDEKTRNNILQKYCQKIEIGNHFWEYEDNCVLKNGVDIDILYRNLDDFENDISLVVDKHIAHNCYTTCMWHNLITCKIVFDKNGKLAALKKRYTCKYPLQLKQNIIERNMKLLRYGLPNFEHQILKAVERNDINSINHRTTEFMASYFDIIFAINELTHPGEKRLIQLCKQNCKILPLNFEKNIVDLYQTLYVDYSKIADKLNNIINELEKII